VSEPDKSLAFEMQIASISLDAPASDEAVVGTRFVSIALEAASRSICATFSARETSRTFEG
jgi:hypothetical protein